MTISRAPGDAPDNMGKDNVEMPCKDANVKADEYEYQLIDKVLDTLKKLDLVMQTPLEGLEKECQQNHEIIENALHVIQDAGARMKLAQTGGPIAAFKVLSDFKANKQKYVGDMETLGRRFAEVNISEATLTSTVDLWRDLQKSLKGLHDVTANILFSKGYKKDSSGFVAKLDDKKTYPTTCPGDGFFKNRTDGISKYSLILNYAVAANNLENVIKGYENKLAPKLTP